MKLFNFLNRLCFSKSIGFISPSVELQESEYRQLEKSISEPNHIWIDDFEKAFAQTIGAGECVSFAAGRMAFYSILKVLGVGVGDEVVLTGFTCSVMANAVIRTGARPIYADIDKDTLGMSPTSLEKKLNERTKVIVAQHSFGIPCKIDEIKRIAHLRNIFLIEDCAISFMSSYKSVRLGDWGDAAIFSTDHTKPLNTLVGGLVYTKNKELISKIRGIQGLSLPLNLEHQRIILERYRLEHKIECVNHKLYIFITYLDALRRKIFKRTVCPYLNADSIAKVEESYYPYPSPLPAFLAYIGLKSLDYYEKTVAIRKQKLREAIESLEQDISFPIAYYDKESDIIPLRIIAFSDNEIYREGYDGIWFQQPIVATVDSLEKFGYYQGSCPVSEKVGKEIVNFPVL